MNTRIYDILPIPCEYRGITFRSRLEVRWAVFFDYLGWEWIYEHEYFKLPSGNYLPDFFFPDIIGFAEAKPNDLNEVERKKCVELSELFPDVPVLLLTGNPSYEVIKSILNGGGGHKMIPMPINDKFYPFYLSDEYDAFLHEITSAAISESQNFIF